MMYMTLIKKQNT